MLLSSGSWRKASNEEDSIFAGDDCILFVTIVAVPTVSRTPTMVTTAVFAFVHAITFNAPFTRVKVELLTTVPFAAVAVTVAANPVGAAWTEFADIAPAI